MGYNTESMIKSAISETITEELFRELGFYVLKLGQENILNPITQLERFIKMCNGKFRLKKSKKDCISSIDYVRKLPDFLIVHNKGEVIFLEVKYRYDGYYNPDDLLGIFPSTKILVINNLKLKELKAGDYAKTDFIQHNEIEENQVGKFMETRFHIWNLGEGEGEEIDDSKRELMTLEEWLNKNFGGYVSPKPNHFIYYEPIIDKYEELVSKWIIDTRYE